MKENNNQLKINLGPLVLVAVLLVVFVFVGSLWNKERTKQKLAKMLTTSERIYSIRKDNILEALKRNDAASESALVREMNVAEKGVYQISFLIKKENSYRLVGNYYGDTRDLNALEMDRIRSLLSTEKAVATDTDVFAKQEWIEDRIYVFTPIKDKDGGLVGYFVVGVNRKQDL